MTGFFHLSTKEDRTAITFVQVDRFIKRMKRVTQGNARTLFWLEKNNDVEARGDVLLDVASGSLRHPTE